MSLKPEPIGPVPQETARVAKAAFPKGSLAMSAFCMYPGSPSSSCGSHLEGCSSCTSSQTKNSAEIPIVRCLVDGEKMGSLFHT